MIAVVWFRQDLRLDDNPALAEAAAHGAVVPLFVLDAAGDEAGRTTRPIGGAGQWWLHHSLVALQDALAKRGSRLILRRGNPARIIEEVVAEFGADAVMWNRCYEPDAITRDTAIKTALKARGVAVESFNSALLIEPWTIATKDGGPFRVFSPFWRAARAALAIPPSATSPDRLPTPDAWPRSDQLDDWHLLPTKPDWAGGLRETWTPGEVGAKQRLADFLDSAIRTYHTDRNRPDLAGSSRLSPHLHWGEIGPRQVWRAVAAAEDSGRLSGSSKDAESYLRELGWREFSYNLLYHFPDLPEQPLDGRFHRFPWAKRDDMALVAWQRGQTGFPIVDAGMRELWSTGWMHNRVRMITASFLVKDLLVPWQEGEAWFWDTLVDADLANNAASWQWVAGCGADAAPYFRVFNPLLQAEKFDPDGTYVRRWVPELAGLPTPALHSPWAQPEAVLARAGVALGDTYPHPIVDHHAARRRALDAFEAIKEGQAA